MLLRVRKIFTIILLILALLFIIGYFVFSIWGVGVLKNYLYRLGFSEVKVQGLEYDHNSGVKASLIQFKFGDESIIKESSDSFFVQISDFSFSYIGSEQYPIKVSIGDVKVEHQQKEKLKHISPKVQESLILPNFFHKLNIKIKKVYVHSQIQGMEVNFFGDADLVGTELITNLYTDSYLDLNSFIIASHKISAKVAPLKLTELKIDLNLRKIDIADTSLDILKAVLILPNGSIINSSESITSKISASMSLNPSGLLFSKLAISSLADDIIFNSINMRGVSSTIELNNDPSWRTLAPGSFKIKEFTGGINIKSISSIFELLPTESGVFGGIKFRDFSGNIFGGTISSSNINFSPQAQVNKFPLKFSEIDLAEILKLYPQRDLEGTGFLEGDIEAYLTDGKISAKGRVVSVQGGGKLKFTPPSESIPSNPGLSLVYRALENYHYTDLVTDISYNPSGDLILGVQLKGFNPNMNKSHPVNVNINIEENLIQLFRALNINKGIEERVLKKR